MSRWSTLPQQRHDCQLTLPDWLLLPRSFHSSDALSHWKRVPLYVAKRKTEQLLAEVQEMTDMPQFDEPLLTVAPEPLQPVDLLDMRGQITDLVMIGRGVSGA